MNGTEKKLGLMDMASEEKREQGAGGVLFLTNNNNTLRLYDWIGKQGVPVSLWGEKIRVQQVAEQNPRLIVSYNYNKMITGDVLEYMGGRVVNLHTSLLPWNRGASPNVWSFLEDTPKGVTIHQVNEGLDTGDILYQRECFFDTSRETFASSYDRLHDVIVELFQEHWEELYAWECRPKPQRGEGSYHCVKDFRELCGRLSFAYTDVIEDVVKKYRGMR